MHEELCREKYSARNPFKRFEAGSRSLSGDVPASRMGVYSPDFECIKAEAYEALEVLAQLGALPQDFECEGVARELPRNRLREYSFEQGLLGESTAMAVNSRKQERSEKLEDIASRLNNDSNLARILLGKLSQYTDLSQDQVASALQIIRRGEGHTSIFYQGGAALGCSGGVLRIAVVNHELPDESYLLGITGTKRAVQDLGTAFAMYFLGKNHSSLHEIRAVMLSNRVDLSYHPETGGLAVRAGKNVYTAKAEKPTSRIIGRKKMEHLLRATVQGDAA